MTVGHSDIYSYRSGKCRRLKSNNNTGLILGPPSTRSNPKPRLQIRLHGDVTVRRSTREVIEVHGLWSQGVEAYPG